MTPRRLWIYTPCGNKYVREQFFEEEVIGLEWPVGDLERFDEYGNKDKFIENYLNTFSKRDMKYAQMCWDFYHTMNEGDIVVWRKTEDEDCKTVSGWGIVDSEYIYDPENPIGDFKSFRQIVWKSNREFRLDTNEGLPAVTLSNVTYKIKGDARYLSILEEYGIEL